MKRCRPTRRSAPVRKERIAEARLKNSMSTTASMRRLRTQMSARQVSARKEKKFPLRMVKTFSCGKKGLVGMDWHAGHYIKAELCNLHYRYFPVNINSQCSYCNKWLRGNTIAYRNAMLKKYDVRIIEDTDLHYKDTMPMNFNPRSYLESLIKKYGNNPTKNEGV